MKTSLMYLTVQAAVAIVFALVFVGLVVIS